MSAYNDNSGADGRWYEVQEQIAVEPVAYVTRKSYKTARAARRHATLFAEQHPFAINVRVAVYSVGAPPTYKPRLHWTEKAGRAS